MSDEETGGLSVFSYVLNQVDEMLFKLKNDKSLVQKMSREIIIGLISSMRNTLHSSAVQTYCASLFSTLSSNEEAMTKIGPFINKWESYTSENLDQQVYSDFLSELELFSKDNSDIELSGKNLRDVYHDIIYKNYFLPYEREFSNRINTFRKIFNINDNSLISIDTEFVFLEPFEFEEFVASLFKKMGYEAIVTSKTGDYGIDVLAVKGEERIGIQVKKYSSNNKVTNIDVQKLIGGMTFKDYRANRGILITTSDFTTNALEQAEGNPVELWNIYKIREVVNQIR